MTKICIAGVCAWLNLLSVTALIPGVEGCIGSKCEYEKREICTVYLLSGKISFPDKCDNVKQAFDYFGE